jgi:hypothetical protein
MSTQTTSSEMLAPQVELGTLVTRALEMDTRQLVREAGRQQAVALSRGIRNARSHFAVTRPGTLRQAPIPHR